MRINILKSFLPLILVLLVFVSACDDDNDQPQTVNINLNGQVGTQPLQFLTDYVTAGGRRYHFTKFSFYISNVSLIRADGTKELVKDVELFDFKTPVVISGDVPRGEYTGLEFGVGLDSLQNAQDPTSFAAEHPQSYARAPYWGWASKYIFAQIEGKAAPNATDTPDQNFLYHTGLDSLYRIVTITKNIEVGSEAEEIDITVQADKLFESEHTIDIIAEPISQTMDNYDLARRIADNFSNCFD